MASRESVEVWVEWSRQCRDKYNHGYLPRGTAMAFKANLLPYYICACLTWKDTHVYIVIVWVMNWSWYHWINELIFFHSHKAITDQMFSDFRLDASCYDYTWYAVEVLQCFSKSALDWFTFKSLFCFSYHNLWTHCCIMVKGSKNNNKKTSKKTSSHWTDSSDNQWH